VISACREEAKRGGRFAYGSGRDVSESKGAGNNWAHGYMGYGVALGDTVLEVASKK
jgi:hypothetical protein